MKKLLLAGALVGLAGSFGAVSVLETTTVQAQKVDKEEKAEGLKALQEAQKDAQLELKKEYLEELQSYVKKNKKADDLGDAVEEIISVAGEVKDYDAAEDAAKDFLKKHEDHDSADNIKIALAGVMLGSGDADKAKDAVMDAVEVSDDLNGNITMLRDLASLQGLMLDLDGARASYDVILEMPEIAGNARYKEYFEGLKKELDQLGEDFDHFTWTDLEGEEFNTSDDYEGKVLLVDFWATWCGPCLQEMPNVTAAYEEYHEMGFEILGISLDNADQEKKLRSTMDDYDMTWRQVYEGKGWKGDLVKRFGVNSIPHTVLLNGEGKIVATNLRGDALERALAILLADEE